MKRIILFNFCLLSLLSCSSQKKNPNLTGTVTLSSGTVDSIYVGLYYYDSYNRNQNWAWLADPIYFTSFKGNDFSLNAEPGRYTLVAFAYGYEVLKERVFIPNEETVLTTNISLVPIGNQQETKEVKLIGEFCEWKSSEALPLTQKGKKWIFDSEIPIKKAGKYQLIVDGIPRNDLSNKIFLLRKDIADFVNLYNGQSISFNPELYIQPRQKSSAVIYGYDLLDQYNQISDEIRETGKAISSTLRSIRKSEAEEWNEKYKTIIESFESIEKKYNPVFQQLLIELRLAKLTFLHPVMYDFQQARHNGKVDSLKLKEVVKGQKFQDFFTIQQNLIQSLDAKSYLLEGDFVGAVAFLNMFIENFPELKEKYSLNDDHFYHFLIDFVKKSPKKKLCTHALYHSASQYASLGEADKVTYLINWLKDDYADEFYVGGGRADKILASLEISEGRLAPDFEVTTLEGNVIKLSDYRGKYVFLDFWGSWCGPCLGEIPNNKKLANTISSDKLQIIGLANDDEKSLRKFLEKEPLPYENAIAPKDIIKAYGITGYPTTFLINPEGKICAKSLRGEHLVDLVLEEMGLPISN